jgi:hypothetical protein
VLLLRRSTRLVDLFNKTLEAASDVLDIAVANLNSLRIVDINDRRLFNL